MRKVILAIIFSSATLWGQSAATPSAQPLPSSVRIVAPKAGDKLVNDFVDVRYEAPGPVSASGAPQFRVRLDGREPVVTGDTSQTFTGLTPGRHTVSVEMVDANGTPLAGTLSQIEFLVLSGQNSPNRLPRPNSQLKNVRGHFQQAAWVDASQHEPKSELPETGSALPLLSVIGLGVLIGGLASALKITRTSS